MSAHAIEVRLAEYAADLGEIRRIRFAVFVDEQRVPAEIEMDERDPLCIHVLAFDGNAAVGTGRLDVARSGKVGRVAVLASHRGLGVGTAIMARLHELAAEQGLRHVWCNAQVSALAFYSGLGYRAVSETFDEAGIEHVRMERDL